MISFDNSTYRRLAFAISFLFFAAGLIISVNENQGLIKDIALVPALSIVLVGAPLTVLLNAVEYRLMGNFLKQKTPFFRSIEVCMLASAANMLPLPGGAITRIAGLKKSGATYANATKINLLFGLLWLALSLILAGASLRFYNTTLQSRGFLIAGFLLLSLTIAKMLLQRAPFSLVLLSLLQRLALVTVDALRLWGCLIALNVEADLVQALVFVLGGVLGSAVSIVPAGLGIREGVSAGLAPLVGLGASVGFLAAALNRLLGLFFLIPIALLLLFMQKGNNAKGHNETSPGK